MTFFDLLIDAFKIPLLLLVLLSIGRFFYGEFTLKLKHTIVRNNIELIFGSIILFSAYAIIKTSGKTVLSLALIMLILQYFFFNIRPNFKNLALKKVDFFNLILMSVVFFFFFALQLYKYDFFNENIMQFGLDDYSFYSDTAERMLINGNEQILEWRSAFAGYDFSYETSPSPYHFYELWIDTFLLSIAHCNGIYIFLYLLFPFIGTLIFSALFSFSLSFYDTISQKKWVGLLFISLLFVFFVGKIPFKEGGFISYSFSHPRLFSFYLIFPLFFILHRLNLKIVAYTSLSFLAYFNILYAPTIIATFFVLFIVQYFIFKNKKNASYALVLFLVNSLFLLLFYFVLFNSNSSSKPTFNYEQFFPVLDYFKTIFHQLIRLNFARVWFFYLPLTIFVGYFLYLKRKQVKLLLSNEKMIVILLLYLISAFLAVSIPHSEKGTIHSIILNPLLTILSLYGFIFILKTKKSFLPYSIASLFLIQASYAFGFNLHRTDNNNSYSTKFIHDIEREFSVNNKIGTVISYINPSSKSPYQYSSITCQFTSVLDIVGNGYVTSFISVPLDEDDCPYDLMKPYITQTPFYKFGNYKMSKEEITDIGEIQKQFLQEYNIGYLFIAPKAEIPTKIAPLIDKVFLDELSGLKLLILKQN